MSRAATRTGASATSAGVLQSPAVRTALPFINGGIAGCVATICIQPIDMVKVRIQLAGEGARASMKPSPFAVARDIIASGRVLDLYTGLSAGLLRQCIYTTARLGFFDTFQARLAAKAKETGQPITFAQRAASGLAAGGIAAAISNPADLALIRMQADGTKPVAQRANYHGVIDALRRIAAQEGIAKWWTGSTPTILRAMALNFGQLSFFAEAKAQLKQRAPSMSNANQSLVASAIAGFFASFFSLPFDFVKTRLQKQQKLPDGTKHYKSTLDCFIKVAKEEGPLRYYKGFLVYYTRIAPHAMITLLVADYLKLLTL